MTDSTASRRTTILTLIGIIALAGVLTLNRLGNADVCGFNEAVEGVFTQQMVEQGELLFPLLNARTPMYKPPLYHWTATAIDRIAGISHVTTFNLRLPAALYGIAGIALTFLFANELLGLSGAVLAGLILCGSYQYIEQARIGRVDMTLCFFETLALFTLARWSRAPNRDGLRYLFAIALGLAVLAKGPVGAVMPAAAAGIFLVSEKRWTELRSIASPGPILIALVIGLSWYAACYFSGRYAFLHRQIGSENFGRFFGSLGAMVPWYYVLPLLLNSAPLSLFVPIAVVAAIRTYFKRRPQDEAGEERQDATMRLFAIFWFVTVIFFSLAAYKRRSYLLPIWPAASVMLAWITMRFARSIKSFGRFLYPSMVAIAVGSAIFNCYYLPRKPIRECGHDSFQTTAREINRIVGQDEPLYSYGLGDEPAALIFYLDRNAPPIAGKLGDAPPGYVIIPARMWRTEKDRALDLTPVYTSSSGSEPLTLLRRGAALAQSRSRLKNRCFSADRRARLRLARVF